MLSNMYPFIKLIMKTVSEIKKESICSTMYFQIEFTFFSKIKSNFQTYPSEYHWWVEAVQIVDY